MTVAGVEFGAPGIYPVPAAPQPVATTTRLDAAGFVGVAERGGGCGQGRVQRVDLPDVPGRVADVGPPFLDREHVGVDALDQRGRVRPALRPW